MWQAATPDSTHRRPAAWRRPESITTDRGYGFRVRCCASPRNDDPGDCFAVWDDRAAHRPGMTAGNRLLFGMKAHVSPRSRGADAPELCMLAPPDEGRGECRVLDAPAVSRAKWVESTRA